MKFSSHCLVLFAGISAASAAVTSSSSSTTATSTDDRKLHGRAGHNSPIDERSFPFPRVYTAIIPAPSKNPPGEDHIYFAAEVDLLDTIESRADSVKISFLVHDSEQLHYLKGLVHENENVADHLQIQPQLSADLQHQVHYSDAGSSNTRQSAYSTIDGFSCYKDLQGTFDWMNDMVVKGDAIPNLTVTVSDIGDSYLKTENAGGHDMLVMKITGTGTSSTNKGVFFAMSGIHAREYAPPELASRWAESLMDAYGNDADITAMLDHTEIHLVFQSNPDGRQVAETNRNVLRRKNMNPNGNNFFCRDGFGVDLNRNFPFQWGQNSGSSSNKCSQTYRGTAPGSEPEVQAIMNYVSGIFPEGQRKADPEGQKQVAFDESDTMGIFFDIHAYGEIIIWPWGHEELETGNDSGFQALANKYRHFNGYDYSGPNNGYLYAASGTTDDWAYGALGAAGITFELGSSFYQDCNYFENSILNGNMEALTYSAKTASAPYSLSKGPDVTALSVAVNGNSLSVTASVSDSAWSSSNHPTSQQGVSEVRVFINDHPYDGDSVGSILSSDSSTVDISALPSGRHMVYIEATDGDGYKGPVTAAFFIKEGGSTGPDPTASPVARPVPSPVARPVPSPVASPIASPPAECADTTSSFDVSVIDLVKDCDWLSINMSRFDFLCQFLDVANACPLTCKKCDLFA